MKTKLYRRQHSPGRTVRSPRGWSQTTTHPVPLPCPCWKSTEVAALIGDVPSFNDAPPSGPRPSPRFVQGTFCSRRVHGNADV